MTSLEDLDHDSSGVSASLNDQSLMNYLLSLFDFLASEQHICYYPTRALQILNLSLRDHAATIIFG